MLFQIMKHIHNFFVVYGEDGTYKIEDGTISLPSFVKANQYFMIEGSIFNDGVYQNTNTLSLTDEVFCGRITALNPPSAFLEAATEIASYVSTDKASPFQSESFGGYSYSKASSSSGGTVTWKDVFRAKLDAWRKI